MCYGPVDVISGPVATTSLRSQVVSSGDAVISKIRKRCGRLGQSHLDTWTLGWGPCTARVVEGLFDCRD